MDKDNCICHDLFLMVTYKEYTIYNTQYCCGFTPWLQGV